MYKLKLPHFMNCLIHEQRGSNQGNAGAGCGYENIAESLRYEGEDSQCMQHAVHDEFDGDTGHKEGDEEYGYGYRRN